jgi:tripartite-type tricarboxylate transporter receptor subunit TctC
MLTRRTFATALSASIALPAIAQDWSPTKPVRIIVPIVGSTNDVVARLVAPELSKAIGQPVIVENKPGAGGNIGADMVAKAPPDGHTLLVGYNGPLAVNVTLFDKMPYDPVKDLQPLTLAVKSPQYLVVNPNSGITSVQDLVAKAKAQPGNFTFGTAGNGTPGHLNGEMFRAATGTDLKHVPYRGSAPAVTDLLGGQINVMFDPLQSVLPYVQSGKLVLLGVSSATRSSAAPSAPTFAEAGLAGFEATAWWGVYAPANLPGDVAARLNTEIDHVVHAEGFRKLLEPRGEQVIGRPRETFVRFNEAELAKWGKAVRESGATID